MSVTVFYPRIDTTDTSSTAETTLAAQAATALEESHSAAAPVKKVFVTTQGCQMNVYDSDKMLDVLGDSHGMQVTHDIDEAVKVGQRISILNGWRLVQTGTPNELRDSPADDYVAQFMSAKH